MSVNSQPMRLWTRGSQSPSARVDKLMDKTNKTRFCPRAYPHSLASRPQGAQAQ